MKINLFKISEGVKLDLLEALDNNGYECIEDKTIDEVYTSFYVKEKHTVNQSWLDYYKEFIGIENYKKYVESIGSDILSGVLLIENGEYLYAVVHGQAHFLVRKYCDKDFGLDLAERIIDAEGLKMKHSQTFTSLGKKDITSYTSKRAIEDSRDYGEAFSYMKCKTVDKKDWGENVDFGESARFTFGKKNKLSPLELYHLTDRIEKCLAEESKIKLPRYHKIKDKTIIDNLQKQFERYFIEFLTNVELDDYWLTGVSFNFSNEYHYSLKFRNTNLSDILESFDATTAREIIINNKDRIKGRYDLLTVVIYDENDERIASKRLRELMQVTFEIGGKYYVLYHNEWVEFSESYIEYIKNRVDEIIFEKKNHGNKNETGLIEELVRTGQYIQLHKQNVHIGKYCIEKADLMDEDNIIMIKDQHQQADLVYLIKQATTSIRLSHAGELGENIFNGRNVCLWMIVNRKRLEKLSDFKSFHLLDALNDFRQEVVNRNLTPVIWVSLKNDDKIDTDCEV